MRDRHAHEHDDRGHLDAHEVAPGKRTLTQHLPVSRSAVAAPVQLKDQPARGASADDPFWFADAAAAGVADAVAPLPHGDAIQRSFGRHADALEGVKTKVGGSAAEASEAMGARAYATGDRIGFGNAPDLHLAAHEAAHVVQQRAGVSLAGGVGAADDVYELHADRVADAVVAGKSAEHLLDTGPRGGASAAPAVQRDVDPQAEEPEAKLKRIVDHIEERMTLAESDMGKDGEVEKIEGHAHDIALLLKEATRLARAQGKGGSSATLVPLVGRLDEYIEKLYAWARTVKVFQEKVDLDKVFDRWDQLRQAVGLDAEGRARTYYADWTVHEGDLEKGQYATTNPTQKDLVEDCVNMFQLDQTIGPALAVEQFETMLQEPPAPSGAEASFFERLLTFAATAVLTALPGHLGGLVSAVLGDDEPKLAKAIVSFTEKSAELVIAEGAGATEEVTEGQMKTQYLDRIRKGAFVAMRKTGSALAGFRDLLERMPPHKVAEVHRDLQQLPEKLWAKLKQNIVTEWVNFRASLQHGFCDGHEGILDFDPSRREGEEWFEGSHRALARGGIVQHSVKIAGDSLEEGKPILEGIEDAVRREVAAADHSFLKMPLHRIVTVNRVTGYFGHTQRFASIYLAANGAIVPQYVDDYFMEQYGKGQHPSAPWEDGNQLDGEEKRERAKYTADPAFVQIGLMRVLGKIKTTSKDLL